MPQFRGVDHFALTVTDLAVSREFYTSVLGFLPVLDLGYGIVLLHKGTDFTIGLMQHAEGKGGEFSELVTGSTISGSPWLTEPSSWHGNRSSASMG